MLTISVIPLTTPSNRASGLKLPLPKCPVSPTWRGRKLDVLATKARNTAKAFGVDASNAMVVYKDLLSKITPELKKAPDALEIMSNNVMTLSKTMQNDVPGASAAMSTAMNQV
ncbi:hypothetical protein NXW75_13420 [Bacteroides xylanisolvens]|nr:hypothetical protein [Bacteroides xylanisolvens]